MGVHIIRKVAERVLTFNEHFARLHTYHGIFKALEFHRLVLGRVLWSSSLTSELVPPLALLPSPLGLRGCLLSAIGLVE